MDILQELKDDFLIFATEANNNRAFCDVRDGLKPSQRAVLWEMYTKGYTSNKPHIKCAKVAGGVIASWSPHSDQASYEALVRMSQPWVNNIPEIDFHGANGSLQGGPEAASSRYTECRLSKASEDGFFANIKKDTVDMIDNFSEDEKWPSVFPAVFPRLFVNGSQGIGYTIAQEWEPGNLNEFAGKVKEYLKKGYITCDNIYPDYPTGGIIVNKSEIHNIYETGKGNVILRGRVTVLDNIIQITELPYQTYAEPLIQKIKDLVNAETIVGIEDIYNKSDDNGLLIEILCDSTGSTRSVLQKLYKFTDLQVVFSANQMALVDGIPRMLTLQEYIKIYIDHNLDCLRREYMYDLNKANARLEIVDGLVKALSIIDKVISTIKASKSSDLARQELVSKFKFTENQAKAIIDMKLGKLANLEATELKNELAELNKIVMRCTEFLNNPNLQQKEFLKHLTTFTKTYSWSRRTEIVDINLDEEKKAVRQAKTSEFFKIAFTSTGELKRIAQNKMKNTSDIKSVIEADLKDRIILISATGKMYKINVKDIPLVSPGSSGIAADSFFNDKIVNIYSGKEDSPYLFMITRKGLAKKIKAETVFSLSKLAGAPVMKVDSDDEIIDCRLVDDDSCIDYEAKGKKKSLKVSDYLDKGRTAGGIAAIKTKQPFTLL